MSQLNDWLNSLTSMGLRDDLPPLVFGSNYSVIWEAATHPDLGNWEAGTWLMQAKDEPGTAGTVRATFTVTSGVSASGVNPVRITLLPSAQTGITEPVAPFVRNLVYMLHYTPVGGSRELVRAGLAPVLAGVPA